MSTKKNVPFKTMLTEKEMPRKWYNIIADMKNKPEPPFSPVTKRPATIDELLAVFPKGIVEQELSQERYIDIPDEVVEKYLLYRTTPLHRAYNLEKMLGTPARIYYKYEGANPSGSHKLNSAIPQVYYNMKDGIKNLTTETGAGQWGSALSVACSFYGIDCTVFMVKVSYNQKPYRRVLMQTYGAKVISSPSQETKAGREFAAAHPDTNGSLGLAISEAMEVALARKDTNYSLGSVLNHVCLHQTIIGEEARLQMEKIDEYPDIVIGCNGGGSNFSGIAFPFMRDKLTKGSKTRFIAVESTACPKLTKGVFAYDYGDTAQMAPITKMYTLGHNFMPSGIHAGGLRYHGDSPIVSQLYHDGYMEAAAISQTAVFDAAIKFAKTECVVPAPESAHAIAQAILEAEACKKSGEQKVILMNISGNGYLDLQAYDEYNNGKLKAAEDGVMVDEIRRAQKEIENIF